MLIAKHKWPTLETSKADSGNAISEEDSELHTNSYGAPPRSVLGSPVESWKISNLVQIRI